MSPDDRAVLVTDKPVDFTWTLIGEAVTYRLEVEDFNGTAIVSAVLTKDINTYRAPSWLKDKIGDAVARWRVTAFDDQGKQLSQTDWRSFRFARANRSQT